MSEDAELAELREIAAQLGPDHMALVERQAELEREVHLLRELQVPRLRDQIIELQQRLDRLEGPQ